MRCLECGAEIAERAQVCSRCGSWAPVEYQLYVAEDRPADAPRDTAGGLAPAAIHASGEQQRPESAPDTEVAGALLAESAEPPAFATTRLRPGYDIDEVDAFLLAIRDTFLGIREPSLTPDEIREKQFSTTRLRAGYDEEEVDAFLDEAQTKLAAQVSARRTADARVRDGLRLRGSVAMPALLLFLAVGLAIMVPAFAFLGAVLVDAQPTFQLLGAALLLGRFVPLALLLTQGLKFLLQGIVTRPGRIVRVTHGGSSLASSAAGPSYQIAPAAAQPRRATAIIV